MNDPSTSRKLVLVSVVLLGVLASVRAAQGNETGSLYQRLWGIGVIGVILSVVADFAPSLGGPFALLVLLGSLTNGGDKVIQNVLASVSTKIPGGAAGGGGASGTGGGGASGSGGGSFTVPGFHGVQGPGGIYGVPNNPNQGRDIPPNASTA